MKIRYFYLTLCLFLFYQCSNASTKKEECKQMKEKINKLLINNIIGIDTTRIKTDSILNLIDSFINCDCSRSYGGYIVHKIRILGIRKEFSKAINYSISLNEKQMYPLKKSILFNRLSAMQSQYKGDTLSRNKYIKKIVTELKDSLSGCFSKLDSVLQLPKVLNIFTYRKTFTLMQYYYYRAQIEGVDKISEEIDKYQKRINGNKDCFKNLKDPLKNDFMEFNGI